MSGSIGDNVFRASGVIAAAAAGRTGTVDWCSSIKSTSFTAVTATGYFVNTCGGVITVTLPATPSVGDIVSLKDYANTWDNNNVTLCNNSVKINGVCGTATLDTESESVTMIYTDATKGWQNIQTSACVSGGAYIAATGGNQPTATGCVVGTNYKFHKFTGDGCFVVSAGGGAKASADYVVVAAGGGGSSSAGGGGCGGAGAGGFRESYLCATSGPYTASPLAATTSLTLAPGTYAVAVGGGGAAGPAVGCERVGVKGGNSVFSTITSAGGGGGGGNSTVAGPAPFLAGLEGGSGGGIGYGGYGSPAYTYKAAGNEPPTVPSQGFPGGGSELAPPADPAYAGSGGGGGTAVGGNTTCDTAGDGGAGATTSIDGTPTIRAGGGGGGVSWNNDYGTGGPGGGGNGGNGPPYPTGTGPPGPNAAADGTANTGGGGGGGRQPAPSCGCGGAGGDGVVIIRYRFQ